MKPSNGKPRRLFRPTKQPNGRHITKWLSPWHDSLEAFADWIPIVFPFAAGVLGYAMVSNRLRYVHVAGHLVTRRTFDAFAYVTFGAIAIAVFPEVTLPLLFLIYLLSAPVKLAAESIPWRKAPRGADDR